MEDFKIFFISFLEKSPPSKKEFRKKPSSISLDLILQQDSMAIDVPVVEIPSVPTEKSVENDVLLKQSSQENPKVDIDLHEKPKEEERKEKEEEKVPEPVAEPEPKFSKINIGDEPKKSTSTMSKQVNNNAKKESKIIEHHEHFRDDDKRVSSAGSSSSSSSGAELYVGTPVKNHNEFHHEHLES